MDITETAPIVVLINNGGYRLELSWDLYSNVKLIERLISDLRLGEDGQPIEIPIGIDDANVETMEKIKEFLQCLTENEGGDKINPITVPSAQAGNSAEIEAPRCFMKKWEEDFAASLTEDLVYSLMVCSNYLEIPALLDLCTSIVANMIRGRSAEEVREILGIECDFTEEELEQIHKENAWLAD